MYRLHKIFFANLAVFSLYCLAFLVVAINQVWQPSVGVFVWSVLVLGHAGVNFFLSSINILARSDRAIRFLGSAIAILLVGYLFSLTAELYLLAN
jgi:hypothetical protein